MPSSVQVSQSAVPAVYKHAQAVAVQVLLTAPSITMKHTTFLIKNIPAFELITFIVIVANVPLLNIYIFF